MVKTDLGIKKNQNQLPIELSLFINQGYAIYKYVYFAFSDPEIVCSACFSN